MALGPLGLVLTLVWLGFAFWYVSEAVGFENLLLLLPQEIALFVIGVVLPLGVLWFILAFFRFSRSFGKGEAEAGRAEPRAGAVAGGTIAPPVPARQRSWQTESDAALEADVLAGMETETAPEPRSRAAARPYHDRLEAAWPVEPEAAEAPAAPSGRTPSGDRAPGPAPEQAGAQAMAAPPRTDERPPALPEAQPERPSGASRPPEPQSAPADPDDAGGRRPFLARLRQNAAARRERDGRSKAAEPPASRALFTDLPPLPPESARSESAYSEPAQPEPVQPEPVQPQSARPEPARPEPVQAEPVQPEAAQPEAAPARSARPGPGAAAEQSFPSQDASGRRDRQQDGDTEGPPRISETAADAPQPSAPRPSAAPPAAPPPAEASRGLPETGRDPDSATPAPATPAPATPPPASPSGEALSSQPGSALGAQRDPSPAGSTEETSPSEPPREAVPPAPAEAAPAAHREADPRVARRDAPDSAPHSSPDARAEESQDTPFLAIKLGAGATTAKGAGGAELRPATDSRTPDGPAAASPSFQRSEQGRSEQSRSEPAGSERSRSESEKIEGRQADALPPRLPRDGEEAAAPEPKPEADGATGSASQASAAAIRPAASEPPPVRPTASPPAQPTGSPPKSGRPIGFRHLVRITSLELNALAMDMTSILCDSKAHADTAKRYDGGERDAFFDLLIRKLEGEPPAEAHARLSERGSTELLSSYKDKFDRLLEESKRIDSSGALGRSLETMAIGRLHGKLEALRHAGAAPAAASRQA